VLLSSLAVPDQVFLDLQREAKQMATVNEIYKKLLTKTAKVLRVFKKKREKSREACA
jgi:RNA dependent RNA polymerase